MPRAGPALSCWARALPILAAVSMVAAGLVSTTSGQGGDAHAQERHFRAKFIATIPQAFDPAFKNPCWWAGGSSSSSGSSGGGGRSGGSGGGNRSLHCIPFAFILGQPKCGTTELYSRLLRHPLVEGGRAKEVRYFSQTTRSRRRRWLTKMGHQSLYRYAAAFTNATQQIQSQPQAITIDGGPHTLWWPHEGHGNLVSIGGLPNAVLLRRINPDARLIVAVRDPIDRAVSDFRFKPGNATAGGSGSDGDSGATATAGLNAESFRTHALASVAAFEECFARDQHHQHQHQHQQPQHQREPQQQHGPGGALDTATVRRCIHQLTGCCGSSHRQTGRLGLGLYGPLLEPWLRNFNASQLLVVRLEDLANKDKQQAELSRVFAFLELPEPSAAQWAHVLEAAPANANPHAAFEVDGSTAAALRRFYAPFDTIYGYRDAVPPATA